jgi:Uma2 family endonuclease
MEKSSTHRTATRTTRSPRRGAKGLPRKTVSAARPPIDNLAELVEQLGDIPLHRIRLRPPPGTATEKDVLLAERRDHRLCELVEKVLVEKAMGATESLLAGWLVHLLWNFLERQDLGVALTADGTLRLAAGLVRIPDVSFISWDRLPSREFPDDPIPNLVPDLAVEVISAGNTKKEMERKLREYFEAGVLQVWLIYPKTQTAEIYTAPDQVRRVGKSQALDGGTLLPGFTLPLRQLFARTGRK